MHDLWNSDSIKCKEQRKYHSSDDDDSNSNTTSSLSLSFHFSTEFKTKENKSNNHCHIYVWDITFELNHADDVASTRTPHDLIDSKISIRLGALIEFQKGALYIQTNPLDQNYLMSFADGICIEDTGPIQMAKVFLEAFEACIIKECNLVVVEKDGTSTVSIQMVHYHPGLDQNVRLFHAQVNDYRTGYVGSIPLNLFETHLCHPTLRFMELFQDWWSQHFIMDQCFSSVGEDISTMEPDAKAKNQCNDTRILSPVTHTNPLWNEEQNDGTHHVTAITTITTTSSTQPKKRPRINAQPLHGVLRSKKKKKKTSKLIYETM
jgi:hypothetical protein